MRILLLSAYDAESHQHWREMLIEQLPAHDWTVLVLPGRFFSWRIRGNSLSWAFGNREELERPYDLVIATSMTDLSALRGFVPALALTPAIVYFHENQFAYPSSGREFKSVEPCILNLYTALAADYVVFNSQFNRNSFLEGVSGLLARLPDQIPSGLVSHLTEMSSVLPVPLKDDCLSSVPNDAVLWKSDKKPMHRPVRIVWAARWEYDKGPDRLLAIIEALEASGLDYRLAILGQKFRHTPDIFEVLKSLYAHRIDQFGYADSRTEYLAWLHEADLFLSTATHEFQGISVLEAVAQGCIPVLPERQVYPSLFGTDYLYQSDIEDCNKEAKSAVKLIMKQYQALQSGNEVVPDVALFTNSMLIPQYQKLIADVIRQGR